jgi:2-dehydro-3-deoxyphosphogluconate aldolase/(4S)-4-hydroxy-2-oxoglutarate aldolase
VSIAELSRAGVIAVIRAPSAAAAIAVADAALGGGVRAVEITFTTPDAPRAIERLSAAGALVGAGSLTTAGQARAARDHGARFAVTPGLDDELVAEVVASGLPTVAGAYTAGEVMRARRLGAQAVKLFPAGVGGVALLRALRDPFPDLAAIPTGGVTPDNLAEWLAAGAVAVGAGAALCPPDAVLAGRYEEIRARAQAFAAALEAARRKLGDSASH